MMMLLYIMTVDTIQPFGATQSITTGLMAFNGGVTKYHASSRKFEASLQAVLLLFLQSRPTDAHSTTFRLQVEKKSEPIRLYCNPSEVNDSSTINSMQTQMIKSSDNRAFRKQQDSMHHDDKNKWHAMLEELKAYKHEHGDCIMPQLYDKDKALGLWVMMQCNQRKANLLAAERKAKLDSIGFVWAAI